jgi:hypothetical protein
MTGYVYLVQTEESYEAPSIIEAHLEESGATARVDALNAYAETAPMCPAADDSDEVWGAYWEAESAWKAAHPLGPEVGGYLQQRYVVSRVSLAQPA